MSSQPSHAAEGDGYGQEIAAELERHGILQLSGDDFHRMLSWYEAGVPEWLAVETIARVFNQNVRRANAIVNAAIPRDSRLPFVAVIRRPLRYYEPAVLEATAELREMEAPGARQLPEPCDTFTLHAAPGRPCLNCGWKERDHGNP